MCIPEVATEIAASTVLYGNPPTAPVESLPFTESTTRTLPSFGDWATSQF